MTRDEALLWCERELLMTGYKNKRKASALTQAIAALKREVELEDEVRRWKKLATLAPRGFLTRHGKPIPLSALDTLLVEEIFKPDEPQEREADDERASD